MTSSKVLFFLSVSFIVGIFLESIIKLPQYILCIFLLVGVFFIFSRYLSRYPSREWKSHFLVAGFCVLFLVLGVLRIQISEFNITNDQLSQFNGKGEISLAGTIIDEPKLKDSSQSLKIKVDGYKDIILVTVKRYPEYKYLDKIEITGKLETPMETEDFSYKNYLQKDHIYSVMYFPKITVSGKANFSFASYIYSGILTLKGKMRGSIRNNFLPPQSSVLEGIILGDKNAISQDIKDGFRIAGLSHIIAVSGLHLVILTSIVMYFFMLLGLGRSMSFYAVAVFIAGYVALVGLPASAVRAGVMAIAYLLGQKLGRQAVGTRIIVLAGASMLLINPLLLFYDVGFQLSFLAVLGIILLDPIIKSFIKVPDKYKNILSLFTVTVSAQIFTLPVIIYNFGSVSLVSIFTNILILPVVPAVMLFGFLSSLAGIIFSSLGWILSMPCYFLLKYVFYIVDLFSKPWAYQTFSSVPWTWIALFYLALGILTRYFNQRLRTKFLDY
jgi:competence protein ComEC